MPHAPPALATAFVAEPASVWPLGDHADADRTLVMGWLGDTVRAG